MTGSWLSSILIHSSLGLSTIFFILWFGVECLPCTSVPTQTSFSSILRTDMELHPACSCVLKLSWIRMPRLCLYSIGDNMPFPFRRSAMAAWLIPFIFIRNMFFTTPAAYRSGTSLFRSFSSFLQPQGVNAPVYSPFFRFTSRWLRIFMEISRQQASFIRFLNGTTISSLLFSSLLSIWSLTAIKRTPRAGNSLSMYFPESIYSLPKRDRSFTATQSTFPLLMSSIIIRKPGRSKSEPL